MNVPRRRFLHLAAIATALPAFPRIAGAQTYPTRPIRIVVPFTAAGPTDIIARLVGQWLSDRLGQQFFTENRPGAGGTIGTEAALRAAPDGYTLLQAGAYNVINAALYENLNFNFVRDVTPVASIVRVPVVMEVNSTFPARTVPEFIEYAKANPGKINMASSGTGGTPHVAGELFKMMANVNMVHVPYRGSAPAINDLIGGQVQVMFDLLSSSVEHIRGGRLRALAIATTFPSQALPSVPTVSASVPGYEASGWFGLGAPKGVSADIVDKLNKEVNIVLADPKVETKIADLGGEILAGSPADFGKLIADETEKWAKVVKFAGIKAE